MHPDPRGTTDHRVAAAASWHAFRMVVAGVGVVFGLVVAAAVGEPLDLLAPLAASLSVVDAARSRRRPESTARSIALDITVAGLGMAFLRPSSAALVSLLVYFAVLAIGLLPRRERFGIIAYGSVWAVAVAAISMRSPSPISTGVDVLIVLGTGTLAVAVVVVLGSTMDRLAENDRAVLASLDVRVRYEHAVVLCSRALLRGDIGITEALEALRRATGAHQVFVDVTEEHPGLGPCARLTHEVLAPGYGSRDTVDRFRDPDTGEEFPRMLPYTLLPTSFAKLSRGEPVVVETRRLPPGPERDLYEEGGLASELNLPILVDGRWYGSLGFGHFDEPFRWEDREIEFLRTAADMFGAFFERSRDRERLVASIVARDELIASVSHELRTPLSVIIGLASELRDRSETFDPEERDGLVELIASQSAEMGELIADLLVAAADDDRFDLVVAPEVVAVGELVRQLVDGPLAMGVGEVEIVDDGSKAWTDPVRFRQIVRNLLTNARRYGGPHVSIRIEGGPETTTVEVIDDGPGIPDDQVAEAFAAYGRAHRRATQTESMGLGLAVCRKLASSLGGGLEYERRDGLTVFRVWMPAAEA